LVAVHGKWTARGMLAAHADLAMALTIAPGLAGTTMDTP
jgi:hypothetical protein